MEEEEAQSGPAVEPLCELYFWLARKPSDRGWLGISKQTMFFPWNDFFQLTYILYGLRNLDVISRKEYLEILDRTSNWKAYWS